MTATIPDQTMREALMGLGYVDPQHQTFEAVEEDDTIVYWDGWGEGRCPQGPMIRTDLASLLRRCRDRFGVSGVYFTYTENVKQLVRCYVQCRTRIDSIEFFEDEQSALIHALAVLYRSTKEKKG